MAVFGLLLTMQIRVHQQAPVDASRLRADELVKELRAKDEQLKQVTRDRDKLATELEKVRKGAPEPVQPKTDQTVLELLAGTTEISGPGLIITLAESTDAAAKARVQDEDLWLVINELLAAGAEGIALNGQRLTSVSAIRNVGQRIMVHQTMIHAPVEIQVIGDPAVMEAALRMRGGVMEAVSRWGLKMTIAKRDNLRLPAFRGEPAFRFAKPAR